MKLPYLVNQLENKISENEKININISNTNVGWHIEHSLLVIDEVIKELASSNPKNYTWNFNIYKYFIFIINKIPRGRKKSPSSVHPLINYDKTSLHLHVLNTKKHCEELNNIKADQFFQHPHLGKLNLKSSIKFLELHTEHHLKIIDDILLKNKMKICSEDLL